MKRKLILFLSSILFMFACKNNTTNTKPPQVDLPDDVSLVELEVNGKPMIDELDESRSCTFGDVKMYSVVVKARSKTANAILTVGTDHIQADGSGPEFKVHLSDGENLVKVVSTSAKDKRNRKIYAIKITKTDTGVEDASSSKLSELKVDGNDVLPKMENNVCLLDDVNKGKEKVSLKVTSMNAQARIEVTNRSGNRPATVLETGNGSYDVVLLPGLNVIKVIVTSEVEGEKCYAIKIYKEEDLSLQTCMVDDREYYDSSKDKLAKPSITFPHERQIVVVKAKAKSENVSLILKVNGNEINPSGDSYAINLVFGSNNVEIAVVGGDGKHSREYRMIFYRTSLDSETDVLITLKAEDVDLLPLLSGGNSVTLKAVSHEKTSLKLEAKSLSSRVQVKNGSAEVSGSGDIFNVPLNEGGNRISVLLYNGDTLRALYLVFITKNPKQEEVPAPSSGEVTVSIFVSDGVNGTSVNGTKLNIFKTKENATYPFKTLTIIDGKAKVNLEKDVVYDFKLEGLNTETVSTRYAASSLIAQHIDDNKTVVSMVQSPLLIVTRPAQAPEIKEVKFGTLSVLPGDVINADKMKNITVKVITSSIIDTDETLFGTPSPMLAVGFVPARDRTRNNGVISSTSTGTQKKVGGGKYESGWLFQASTELVKGDISDVVCVIYDKAGNRLEYHLRVKSSNTVEETNDVSVENLKLKFKRLPTPSTLFSVGEDMGTGSSTHYTASFRFDVKENSQHVKCIGFDIYRKCLTDNQANFEVAKRFMYQGGARASNQNYPHTIAYTDSVLEDEKEYEYKIVAYTMNGKKSLLSSSPSLRLNVPKSNTVLLQYPIDRTVVKADVEQSGYKFKLTNPKILETAQEMKFGIIITDRIGTHYWGSKIKYIFDNGSGRPELFFANSHDAIPSPELGYGGTRYSLNRQNVTDKSVEELISINKENGEVTIHSAFFTINMANVAKTGKVPPYNKGDAYFWDIVDFGERIDSSDDDLPLEITSKELNGVTIISPANDFFMGNNAWNGRAEFNISSN